MSPSEPSPATSCASCGAPLHGRFCAACGEKVVEEHDLSLRHLLEHVLEAFTHADGKIFGTLRALLTQPGQLTADFFAGRRKRFLAPLSLFLVVNAVFFFVMPRLGWNTVTTPLEVQLSQVHFSSVARAVVEHRLAETGEKLADYSRRFNQRVPVLAHSCVILLVPLTSLVLWALFWPQRRQWPAHVIFALHYCAFWLLFMCGILGCANVAVALLGWAGGRVSALVLDNVLSLIGFVLLGLYVFHAARRAYGGTTMRLLVKSVALVLAGGLVLDAYRLLLFLLTNLTV